MGAGGIRGWRITVALLLTCAVALAAAGSAVAGPRAHSSIGFEPTPISLATDAAGHVYVANPQFSKQVLQYSSEGQQLAAWGDFGVAPNAFFPRDVATDPAGDVWVTDGPAEQVVELGTDGSEIRKWPAKGRALAISAGGDVYVLESHEVQRFSPEGTLISKWDSVGGREFGEAWGIATSPSGLVYVAETYGNQIDIFNPDGSFVSSWGKYGKAPGQFVLPYGIAVAPSGDVYVTDTGNSRVEEFTATGTFIRALGRPGWQAGRFYTPTGVAVDPAGNVYVADAGVEYPDDGTARIQKFSAEGQFLTAWGDIPKAPPSPARLSGGPKGTTMKRSAVFRFTPVYHRPGLQFQCRLSGRGISHKRPRWHLCTSPKRYSNLPAGPKTFSVRGWSTAAWGPVSRRSWTIAPR